MSPFGEKCRNRRGVPTYWKRVDPRVREDDGSLVSPEVLRSVLAKLTTHFCGQNPCHNTPDNVTTHYDKV